MPRALALLLIHFALVLAASPSFALAADGSGALEAPAQKPEPPVTLDSATGELDPGMVFKDCADCPEMVVIPPGSFDMGSRPEEVGRFDSEGPVHRVSVKSFALGKFEVTRGQFAAFVSASGYRADNECYTFEDGEFELRSGRGWQNPGYPQEHNHPVMCVSWDDANAYIEWLSHKTGKHYRLASEAEWEYAARAGTATSRYWGDETDQACAFANVMDVTGKRQVSGVIWEAYNCDDGRGYTTDSGRFKPNAFGLYDMIGNAWEWTEDCWNANYHSAPTDGSAWITGDCSFGRVLRGASWDSVPRVGRSASRNGGGTGVMVNHYGFRLARTLP